MKLSKTELKMIADLLEMAGDEFANHGCNDLELEPTEENKELAIKMLEKMMGKGEDFEQESAKVREAKKKIWTNDWMMMDYLSKRCEEEASNEDI